MICDIVQVQVQVRVQDKMADKIIKLVKIREII
jgi:hypothetical protein